LRRSLIAPAAALLVVLTGLVAAPPAPATPAAPTPAPTPAPARAAGGPDPTVLVPALQQAFGTRFGGWWIDTRATIHVQVVAATPADRARVAALVGPGSRAVTDTVTHSYDALVAASDEIAASLDPAQGHFAVALDVPHNAVVVQTAGPAAPVATRARAAARRGAFRWAARVRDRTPVADPAAAVTVEPDARIEVQSLATRDTFPPYQAGLGITIAVGRTLLRCTTGYIFRNAYGNFGTTAGHCGHVGDGVVIGRSIVDSIRKDGYQGVRTVRADLAAYSLSAHRWSYWGNVLVQGGIERRVVNKLSNTQITNGLRLCFEGITSNGGNCGAVVRTNSTLCCDAGGHSFVFDCINFPSQPGDSGSPVYQLRADGFVNAAGGLSSNVTINGRTVMCFSTIANMQAFIGTLVRG